MNYKVPSFVLVLVCLFISIEVHATPLGKSTETTLSQHSIAIQDWSTEPTKSDKTEPKTKRKTKVKKANRKRKRTVRQKIRQREFKKVPVHQTIQHHSRRLLRGE